MKLKITKYDIILILVIISISLGVITFMFFNIFDENEKFLKIYIDDEIYKEYVLTDSLDEKISIKGLKYENIVEIKNGKVRVTESNCPDKICQKHFAISKNNEMIVCLPNHVIIRIEGKDENDVDYIGR